MAFSEPTASYESATYEITVVDGEGRGLDFVARTGNHDPAVYEGVFQELVTLVASSPSLDVGGARRNSSTVEQVTP